MQPINFGNSWFQLEPISAYWKMSENALNDVKTFVGRHLNITASTPMYWVKTIYDWNEAYNPSDTYPFKDKESFRAAFEDVVNRTLSQFAAYSGATLPHYTAPDPIAIADAAKLFGPSPYFDANFLQPSSVLVSPYLRLFVSTSLFRGPGRYDFLCSDRKVVTFAVDRTPLSESAVAPSTPASASISASASAEHPGEVAKNVLDGSLSSIWHTPWDGSAVLPQWITLDFGAAFTVSGLAYTPRQDGAINGMILEYMVQVSSDGQQFATVASGQWAQDKTQKNATFANVSARYLRLVAVRGVNGFASAVELRPVFV